MADPPHHVQYWSGDDYPAAKILADNLGWPLKKYKTFDKGTPRNTQIAMVGAQLSNPAINSIIWDMRYQKATSQLIYVTKVGSGKTKILEEDVARKYYYDWQLDRLPGFQGLKRGPMRTDWRWRPLTPEDKDNLIIQHAYNISYLGKTGFTVWFVGGWTNDDTLASAVYASENGLKGAYISKADAPSYWPEYIPAPGKTRKGIILELYFKDLHNFMDKFPPTTEKYFGGGYTKLIQNKQLIIDGINNFTGADWRLNTINFQSDKIALEFEDLHSPLLAIAAIIAIIATVAFYYGIFIIFWKRYDWKKEGEKTAQKELENEAARDKMDHIDGLVEAGVIKNSDDALAIWDELNKTTPPPVSDGEGFTLEGMKEIILIAIAGAIIIMLLAQTRRA